ncbi:MAG TPA: nuclear transport factor 2 family protein [Sphingobium sp.]
MPLKRFFSAAAIAAAFCLGLAAQAGGKAQPSADAALARDRLAIEATLQDYVRALDGSDLPAYLATLTEDAKFLSKEGNYYGRKAISDYVSPVMNARLKRAASGTDTVKGTHHVISNIALRFVDLDHAVMTSYWMFVVAHKQGAATIEVMGSAEDHFVRQGGKWLISERHVETL